MHIHNEGLQWSGLNLASLTNPGRPGVRMYYTDKLRKNDASIITFFSRGIYSLQALKHCFITNSFCNLSRERSLIMTWGDRQIRGEGVIHFWGIPIGRVTIFEVFL